MWFLALLHTAVIAISLSIDAFAVSFAYGCKKIKMPLHSALLINLICTIAVVLSFLSGLALTAYITEHIAAIISFVILFSIGLTKLFDSITKSIIRKSTQFNKEIKLSVFNLKLALRLYADPEAADADTSKDISPKEAAVLAISLSLDGLAVGLSAAIIGINLWLLIAFTLLSDGIALLLGDLLGNKVASKIRFNIPRNSVNLHPFRRNK